MIKVQSLGVPEIQIPKWRPEYDQGVGPTLIEDSASAPVTPTTPVAQTDFTTLTYATLPTWLDYTNTAGNRMYYDTSGYLTWAPANMLLNSATLATQTVTTGIRAAGSYILSFKGTGSVAISGGYTGTLAGTGVNDRVYLKFTSTTASLTFTVTGSATEGQLERVTYETTPRTYIATTSAQIYQPRLDTVPATLAARGLLIEESRTNTMLYSEQFSSPTWNLTFNISISAGTVTAPDNTSSAYKIIENTANNVHFVFQGNQSMTSGVTYTLSAYVKAAGRTKVRLGSGSDGRGVDADLTTVTVTPWGATSSGTITSVGNSWYRVTATFNAASTSAFKNMALYLLDAAGNNTYTGDGTSGVYAWGFQLELGAFATSYVSNNTTTSVTRVADIVQLGGTALTAAAANTGSAIVQTSAWFNASAVRDVLSSATTRRLLYSNSSNTVISSTNGTTRLDATIGASGTFTGGAVRVATSWDATGRGLVSNNGTLTSDAIDLGTGVTVTLGGYGTTINMNAWWSSMAVYDVRLPAIDLAAKSTVGASY